MTTVINTPPANNNDSASGPIIGIVIALVFAGLVVLFFVYILPILQNNQQQPKESNTSINVEIPAPQPTPSPTPKQPSGS